MTARVREFRLLHALMSAETLAGTGSVVCRVVGVAINLGRKTVVTIEVKGSPPPELPPAFLFGLFPTRRQSDEQRQLILSLCNAALVYS